MKKKLFQINSKRPFYIDRRTNHKKVLLSSPQFKIKHELPTLHRTQQISKTSRQTPTLGQINLSWQTSHTQRVKHKFENELIQRKKEMTNELTKKQRTVMRRRAEQKENLKKSIEKLMIQKKIFYEQYRHIKDGKCNGLKYRIWQNEQKRECEKFALNFTDLLFQKSLNSRSNDLLKETASEYKKKNKRQTIDLVIEKMKKNSEIMNQIECIIEDNQQFQSSEKQKRSQQKMISEESSYSEKPLMTKIEEKKIPPLKKKVILQNIKNKYPEKVIDKAQKQVKEDENDRDKRGEGFEAKIDKKNDRIQETVYKSSRTLNNDKIYKTENHSLGRSNRRVELKSIYERKGGKSGLKRGTNEKKSQKSRRNERKDGSKGNKKRIGVKIEKKNMRKTHLTKMNRSLNERSFSKNFPRRNHGKYKQQNKKTTRFLRYDFLKTNIHPSKVKSFKVAKMRTGTLRKYHTQRQYPMQTSRSQFSSQSKISQTDIEIYKKFIQAISSKKKQKQLKKDNLTKYQEARRLFTMQKVRNQHQEFTLKIPTENRYKSRRSRSGFRISSSLSRRTSTDANLLIDLSEEDLKEIQKLGLRMSLIKRLSKINFNNVNLSEIKKKIKSLLFEFKHTEKGEELYKFLLYLEDDLQKKLDAQKNILQKNEDQMIDENYELEHFINGLPANEEKQYFFDWHGLEEYEQKNRQRMCMVSEKPFETKINKKVIDLISWSKDKVQVTPQLQQISLKRIKIVEVN